MPLAKIKNASEKELAAVKGIGPADAKRIYEYYHKNK
jgi:ERCC4-type nuclease